MGFLFIILSRKPIYYFFKKQYSIYIYFSGQNLWTLTKYSGLDPEIGSVGGSLELGIDQGFYPQARMASMGLQLGF